METISWRPVAEVLYDVPIFTVSVGFDRKVSMQCKQNEETHIVYRRSIAHFLNEKESLGISDGTFLFP